MTVCCSFAAVAVERFFLVFHSRDCFGACGDVVPGPCWSDHFSQYYPLVFHIPSFCSAALNVPKILQNFHGQEGDLI
jgi:hypothetical protein